MIICYGSINFYSIQWIEDRLRKIVSLLDSQGKIMMKVNPAMDSKYPLPFFNRWTWPLVDHFAQVYHLKVDNRKEWESPDEGSKRLKWTYTK